MIIEAACRRIPADGFCSFPAGKISVKEGKRGTDRMEKLGFIGMGNMGQALAGGFIRSGKLSGDRIFAYAPDTEKLRKNAGKTGFQPMPDLSALIDECDTLLMACKPFQVESVLEEAGAALEGKALLSVALGWNYRRYREILGEGTRIQFIMPNTPAMTGEGVLLFEKEHSLYEEERKEIMALFETVGYVTELPSSLMEIGGAVSGCGPAFVDLLIEAYADAAVKYGIPRKDAYRIVAQTVLGTAKLQLESGLHPGELKDHVCSPGGSTIRGVAELEKKGFRHACIASVDAVMGKEH